MVGSASGTADLGLLSSPRHLAAQSCMLATSQGGLTSIPATRSWQKQDRNRAVDPLWSSPHVGQAHRIHTQHVRMPAHASPPMQGVGATAI